jgi:hypothetical protein
VRIKSALKKAKKAKKDKKAKKTKRDDTKEEKTKKVVQDAVVAGNDVDFFSMITDLLCTDEGLIKLISMTVNSTATRMITAYEA